jgi:hypothetical protein
MAYVLFQTFFSSSLYLTFALPLYPYILYIRVHIVLTIHSNNMRSAAYPYGKNLPNISVDIKERKSKKIERNIIKKALSLHTHI